MNDSDDRWNEPTPEYLTRVYEEALRWPDSGYILRPYLPGSLEHCPSCGGEAHTLKNKREKRSEYICVEPTCGARWCYSPDSPARLIHL